jgi:hypothetical protein
MPGPLQAPTIFLTVKSGKSREAPKTPQQKAQEAAVQELKGRSTEKPLAGDFPSPNDPMRATPKRAPETNEPSK